jgi:hypothetical protein
MLNEACRVARGNVLVFADDDCVFMEGWLENLKEVMNREPDIGLVGGQDELVSVNSAFGLALDHVLQSFIGTGGMRKGSGVRTGTYYPKLWNMAIPKDIADMVAFENEDGQVCVFDESLQVQEDVELARRITREGKRIVCAPEVRIGHKRDTTFGLFVKRNIQKGQTSRQLGTHRLSHSVLMLFSLLVIFSLFTSFYSPLMRSVFFVVGGGYAVILLGASIIGYWRTKRIAVSLMIPVVLIVLHFGRGLGYCIPQYDKKSHI